ncbi:hypothetical protein E4M02_11225 [Brevundimonas sp. S30B]|uniref:hypothetical protein n=1 Tax=unclassified Brevundimonas TaxID=2622653 RepID=UPI00107161AC|nr:MULTISPECIES: hypothetical protein [unclassified Brevundimonas]QBX38685.1 hypothetical protein E4M01_13485 [Brevundimonas sp. MF30-B]TFW01276.1 hypothetical protein E4M02_11225 [Brevundimonas sp. S30B]
MNLFRAIAPAGWAALALLVFLAAVLFWFALDARNDARRAQAGQTLAEGRTAAGADASAIRDRADARNNQISTTTKETTDAIRNAPDDASAGNAGLRGLCQLYPGHDPRCRVLISNPPAVD